MYLFKQEYHKAENFFRKLADSDNKNIRSLGRECLAYIPLYQGKLQQALKTLNNGVVADEMDESFSINYAVKFFLMSQVYSEMKKPILALNEIEKARKIRREIFPGQKRNWQGAYASILAAANRFQEIEQLVEQLEQDVKGKDKELMPYYWFTSGMIESARGNHQAAISNLEKFVKKIPGFLSYLFLARTYFKANKLGDTVSGFEKAISIYDKSRSPFPLQSVKVYYQLGLAYEKSGWNKKAIQMYETFLDIWKNADPDISELADAKNRLAKLKGVGVK